jgi:hypothetical protein
MLKKYLPNKSSSDIAELANAAEKEQPNEEQIGLAKLFSVVSYFIFIRRKKKQSICLQDDEDNYGEFIRVLKRQLNEDKQNYIHDVQEKIENLK